MLAATKVKMSGSQKNEQEHVRYFLRKTRNQEVSRCSRVKQRQTNVSKKCAARAKLLFCQLDRPIVVFSPFSFPLPFRITRLYILFSKLY